MADELEKQLKIQARALAEAYERIEDLEKKVDLHQTVIVTMHRILEQIATTTTDNLNELSKTR